MSTIFCESCYYIQNIDSLCDDCYIDYINVILMEEE